MTRLVRRGRRGQALVEFALVIPIVVLLLISLFDLGRAVYAYTTITNAARDGARLAIVQQAGVENEAADQAVGLGVDPATDVDVAYRTPDLTGTCAAVSIGCVAEVTVNYDFSAVTPLIGNLVGPITMASTSRLPVEAVDPTP